jgi:predicted RND superfamily exporter protein
MTGLLRALVWTVERIIARPRLVVIVAMLLAGIALVTSVRHLRIDPSTLEMISADVPFRRNLTAFTEAFPEFDDPIVAVIEGDTPERVEEAAATLADTLRADSEHFTAVS